jgi:uncharacterized protein (DUF433 family)
MTGIERTDGVCGGSACIAGTRVPVWVLVHAWAYVDAHRHEIDQEIRRNESA